MSCENALHVLKLLMKAVNKGGGPHERSILAGYYGFNANISFMFQAVKIAHPTFLCFGPFCKFFGDFKVHLEINSFSERIS